MKINFTPQSKLYNQIYGVKFIPFTKFLFELGISHRVTCSHISYQNGIVKKKHMDLMEMVLTFVSHSFIPLHFGDQNFSTTIYVINRLLIDGLPKFNSPYDALYHNLASY